jgi:predicted metal-dependent hydrolase
VTKGYSHTIEWAADQVVVDGRHFPFTLRRDARARRMLLRVMPRDGAVVLVLPKRASLQAGRQFLAEQAGWILARQAERPEAAPWTDGAQLPLLGEMLAIRHRPDARGRGAVWLEAGELHVSGRPEHLPRRLRDWLKGRARDEFGAQARAMAAAESLTLRSVTVRDTLSRWGSCSANGNLSFSWRLIMAPPGIVRYMVAHEVAHLRHMDHGDAFWQLVARLSGGDGELRVARTWLKRHGATLHLLG